MRDAVVVSARHAEVLLHDEEGVRIGVRVRQDVFAREPLAFAKVDQVEAPRTMVGHRRQRHLDGTGGQAVVSPHGRQRRQQADGREQPAHRGPHFREDGFARRVASVRRAPLYKIAGSHSYLGPPVAPVDFAAADAMILEIALAVTLQDIAWVAGEWQLACAGNAWKNGGRAHRRTLSLPARVERRGGPLRLREVASSGAGDPPLAVTPLPSARLLAAKRQAGAGRPCNQPAALVGHGTFRDADGLAAQDDEAVGDEAGAPHRAQEVDLELQGGECFTLFEGRAVRRPVKKAGPSPGGE